MNPMAFPFALFELLCPINSVIGHKSVWGACEIRREIVFAVRNRGGQRFLVDDGKTRVSELLKERFVIVPFADSIV
jgi:hypothetical protein